MEKIILGSLIGAIAVLFGTLISILGSVVGDWLNHKRKMDFMNEEKIFDEKIESFKIIYSITCNIKEQLIYFIVNGGKDKSPVNELISKLNNEIYLFSNKQTLDEVCKNIDLMKHILMNPPKFVIEGKSVKCDEKDLKNIANQIGNIIAGITIALKRELKLLK